MRRIFLLIVILTALAVAGDFIYQRMLVDQAVVVLRAEIIAVLGDDWDVSATYAGGDDQGHHFSNLTIYHQHRNVLQSEKLLARDGLIRLDQVQLTTSLDSFKPVSTRKQAARPFRLEVNNLRLDSEDGYPFPLQIHFDQTTEEQPLEISGSGVHCQTQTRNGSQFIEMTADQAAYECILRLLIRHFPQIASLQLETPRKLQIAAEKNLQSKALAVEVQMQYSTGKDSQLYLRFDDFTPRMLHFTNLRSLPGGLSLTADGSWHGNLLRLNQLSLNGTVQEQTISGTASGSLNFNQGIPDGRFPWKIFLGDQDEKFPVSGEARIQGNDLLISGAADYKPFDLSLAASLISGNGTLKLHYDSHATVSTEIRLKSWHPEHIALDTTLHDFRLQGSADWPGPVKMKLTSKDHLFQPASFQLQVENQHLRLSNSKFKLEAGYRTGQGMNIAGSGTLETILGPLFCRISSSKTISIQGRFQPRKAAVLSFITSLDMKNLQWELSQLKLGELLEGHARGDNNQQELSFTLHPGRSNRSEYKPWLTMLPGTGWRALAHLFPLDSTWQGLIKKSDHGLSADCHSLNDPGTIAYHEGILQVKHLITRLGQADGQIGLDGTPLVALKLVPTTTDSDMADLLTRFNLSILHLEARTQNDSFAIQARAGSDEVMSMVLTPSSGRLFITRLSGHLAGLHFQGQGDMDSEGNYSGRLHLDDVSDSILRKLGCPELFHGIDGADVTMISRGNRVESDITIYRPIIYSREFKALHGQIRPLEGRGYTAALQLEASGAMRAESKFFIPDWLTSEGVVGSAHFNDFRPGNTECPGGFSVNPGQINLQMEFENHRGTWSVQGTGKTKNGILRTIDNRILKSISSQIHLNGNSLIIDAMSGSLGIHPLQASGWLRPFGPNGRAEYEMKLTAQNLPYQLLLNPQDTELTESTPMTDLSLTLSSTDKDTQIKGRILVHDGELRQSDVPSFRLTPLENMQLEITMEAGERLRLRTAIFDALVQGRARIVTQNGIPRLNGSLQATAGRIHYLGKSFTLDEGDLQIFSRARQSRSTLVSPLTLPTPAVDMKLEQCLPYRYRGQEHSLWLGREPAQNPLEITTHLSLQGHTRQRGREIRIQVNGTPERLTATFRSEPEMAQDEIERLLYGVSLTAGGMNDTSGADGYALVDFLGNQVQNALWNHISESLEKQLNLDEFSIRPERRDETGEILGDLEIQIGKYVKKDLFISYRKMMMDRQRDALGLEYRVGRNVFLGGQVNQQNELKMDARVGLSF